MATIRIILLIDDIQAADVEVNDDVIGPFLKSQLDNFMGVVLGIVPDDIPKDNFGESVST